MSVYTFSWYTKDRVPRIVHPRWWQVGKKAELVFDEKWVRKAVTDIPQDEADILLTDPMFGGSSHTRLIARFLGRCPLQIQLEQSVGQANSNPSEYVSIGRTST